MSATQFDGEDFLRMIRSALHNPTESEMPSSEILGHYVQLAQNEIASKYEFPWLLTYEDITTVADQVEYTLSATDVLKVVGAEGIDDALVDYLKPTSQANVIRHGDAEGDPYRWWMSGDVKISLWPTPSTADLDVRIWYFRSPTAVTGAGEEVASTSELGQAWDQALVYRSVAIALPFIGRADEVGTFEDLAYSKESIAKKTLPPMPDYLWQFGSTVSDATRLAL